MGRDWPLIALITGAVLLAVAALLFADYAREMWKFGLPMAYMPFGREALLLASGGIAASIAALIGIWRRRSRG